MDGEDSRIHRAREAEFDGIHMKVDQLEMKANAGGMAARAEGFARSLVRSYRTKNFLSEKQIQWVDTLLTAEPGSPHPALDNVQRHLDRLSEREQEFALSLIEQWNKNGYLSSKQDWWATKLSGKITGAVVPNRKRSQPKPIITESNSETLVTVELRPGVWALIDTSQNSILGTFDSEDLATAAMNR